jgi:hypothetical protein
MKNEIKLCKGCKKQFTKQLRRQLFCTTSCCYAHHKEIRRVSDKKGRFTRENALKRKAFNVSKEFKIEVYDFMIELKNKCYFLDAIDSYKLIHYYVELFGVWYFQRMTIEEELYLYLQKCKSYIKKEFKLEKI